MMLRESGDQSGEGQVEFVRARLALAEGNPSEAARHLLESHRLLRKDDERNRVNVFELISRMLVERGDYEPAIELLAVVQSTRERLGVSWTSSRELEFNDEVARCRKALTDSVFRERWAAGESLDQDALMRRFTILARGIVGKQQVVPIRSPTQNVIETVGGNRRLTPRELEILRMLAAGHSTKDVADTLFVTPRTVATHITNILGKLELPSRTAAVAYAMREGLV